MHRAGHPHYFSTLDQVRQAVNQAFYMGLEDLESHFAVYPPGSFYKKHLDRFRDDDARTLTAVLYLNEDWPEDAGGQIRLYLDDACSQSLDMAPLPARWCCSCPTVSGMKSSRPPSSACR
jgi:SM-20-related protein